MLLLVSAAETAGDQLRFDRAAQWNEWKFARSAVRVTGNSLEPTRFRKDVKAALNASEFGGGILKAGSNRFQVGQIIDGEATTGWAPASGSDPEDWFVEIDLGRAVSARRIELLFDESVPPFELLELFLSTGEPAGELVGNPIEGSVVFRLSERFRENRKHRLVYEPEILFSTPIQVLRIEVLAFPPEARLIEVIVDTAGDNLAVHLLERGSALEAVNDFTGEADLASLTNAQLMVDGSIPNGWRNGSEPRKTHPTWSQITLDLGAIYLVDFVRIVSSVGANRGFNFNLYEVMTSDGSLAPDGTFIWTKHFSGLAGELNQQTGLADHGFPAISSRFVRINWLIWDTACADFNSTQGQNTKWICFARGSTQEIQVFGEGFPRSVALTSPLIDLDRARNLNSVEWGAFTPPGTRLEVRTRTGNEIVEKLTYRDKNRKEVTQRRWEKLIPAFRAPVDTLRVAAGDWSPWSTIYPETGARSLSPSPRCYMELNGRLVTENEEIAPRLDWLAVNFTDPIAASTFGEVVPLQATPGEVTEFSYVLRPNGAPTGFDRILLQASTLPRFLSASLNGAESDVAVEADSSGFRVTFPERVYSGDLVELCFESTLFVHSTRFDAFLQDSRLGEEIRQQVDAGDATEKVDSSTNVVGFPVEAKLLDNVTLSLRSSRPTGTESTTSCSWIWI
ncbi:MAG: discoidin domain-containing protein [Candidatus Latescibacterota bacterium]|nr:discoidin domain-containing protein [Candidatus Latescibacterota bacterium]